jgi:hypothetical protein
MNTPNLTQIHLLSTDPAQPVSTILNGRSMKKILLSLALAAGLAVSSSAGVAFASGGTGISGGGGTGGGGGGVVVPATGFGGNWSGTIGDPNVGTGLFTMQLSVVGTTVTGNLRAGAPIFDSGFNMNSGSLTSPTTMVGSIARSQGFIVLNGTLSADGTTITGLFYTNGPGSAYPYTVTRQ